jgi:hypothetical protein
MLLSACQAQAPQHGDKPLVPQTLHSSATCGTEQASLRAVPDATALARLVNPSGALGIDPKPGAVDFSQRSVFQLSMGQQPSAGASLAVSSAEVDTSSGRLAIRAQWQLPDPGRMHAMMITRPCVVFSLPRGDYRSVRVIDQKGQQKLAVDLAK